MSYRVEWEQDAVDALDKLAPAVVQRILHRIDWLSRNFESTKPQPLVGDLKDHFKLRVGDYRVIYTINRTERLVIIELAGHRRDIYKIK